MLRYKSLSRTIVLSIFILAISLVNCNSAHAVPLIDSSGNHSGWEMIAQSYSEGYVSPVTDVVGDDYVLIELYKTFPGPIEYGASQPHVVEFIKVAPDAKQNIIITDEFIRNNTDYEWFDFHMTIINLGTPEAGFDPQHVPNGDQLEEVYYTTPLPGYDGLPTQLNFVNAQGGGVPPSDVFWPGWQDGEIVIVTNPQMRVGDSFLLKEWATVPEPATIVLLGFSSIPLLRKRRRI